MSDRTIRVRLEAVTQQYSQQLRRAAQETRQHGRSMADSARNNRAEWTQLGLAVGAAGAAITLGLRSAGREAMQFESRLMKSVTQIGVSREQMDAMGDAALRLGHTGQGPQTLADALFFVQSAGLRGSEAMAVVEASAKAASIGLGDTATIADLVTSAVNAYGSEAISASGATDILVGTVREGKAEAEELAGSMGRLLPIASNMGVSFDQVGAAMAAMTRTGTGANEAATQLRSIMVSLMRPTQQAEEAMSEFGLSSSELRDTIQRDGLWAALQQIKTAIGDNDTAMSNIFPNVRALAGVLDLTGANAEETGEIFERMTDTTGLLSEGFAEWSTTTEAAQARFAAAMESLKITVGQDVTPVMSSFFDVGTGVAEMLRDMPDPARQAIIGIGGLAGVGATAAGAFLLLFPRIIQTKDAMQALNLSVGRMVFNPYVLAIGAAVTALGFFARAKAQARERVEEMKSTLDEATGAISENTREWVANALIQDELHDAARDLGLSFDTVVDAAMGNADAQRIVAQRTREVTDETNEAIAASGVYQGEANDQRDAAHNLARGVLGLADATADATRERRNELEAMAEQQGRYVDLQHAIDDGLDPAMARLAIQHQKNQDAADEHGESVDLLGDEFDELTGDVEEATHALTEHADTLRAQQEPLFGLHKALGDVADAEQNLIDVMEDSESTQRDVEEAALDLTLKQLALAAASGEAAGVFDGKLDPSLRSSLELMGATDEQLEIVEQAFRDAAEEGDGYATTYEAQVRLEGDRAARDRFRALEREAAKAAGTYRMNVVISQSGSIPSGVARVVHDGGLITASGVQKFHGGGQVGSDGSRLGLASDEVPAILQTGELVLSRDDTAAYRMMMAGFASLPRFHQGGQVGPSGQTQGPSGITVGNLEVKAVGERFSIKQIEDELAMHGVV